MMSARGTSIGGEKTPRFVPAWADNGIFATGGPAGAPIGNFSFYNRTHRARLTFNFSLNSYFPKAFATMLNDNRRSQSTIFSTSFLNLC